MIEPLSKLKSSMSAMDSNRKLLLLSAAAISACWIFSFFSSFEMLLYRWNTDDFSYCYFVPLLSAVMMYQKRNLLPAYRTGSPLPGYCGLAMAALMLLTGRLGSLETLVYFSMWLSITSVLALLYGASALRVLAFPLILLLFAIPAPPFIIRTLTFELRLISSDIAVRGFHMLGISAFREGNVIDLGFAKYQVVDACSGLRYLFPSILIALVTGYYYNRRLLDRALLAVSAFPVTVLLNSFRIVLLGTLASRVDPSLGEEGFFHDLTGWLIFAFTCALTYAMSAFLRRFFKEESVTSQHSLPLAAATHISGKTNRLWVHGFAAAGIFLLLHLAQNQVVVQQTSPPRKSFSDFSLQMDDWEGKRDYLSKEILDNLWADDYVQASFSRKASTASISLLVSWYSPQTTFHSAHAPASCFLGSGWAVQKKEILPDNAMSGRAFAVQRMVLEKDGQVLLANFWFQQRGRIIASEFMNKVYLFWDALVKRRTDGALVRAEMPVPPGQSIEEAQRVLDGFTAVLSRKLMPYVPE